MLRGKGIATVGSNLLRAAKPTPNCGSPLDGSGLAATGTINHNKVHLLSYPMSIATPSVNREFVYYAFRSCQNGNDLLQRIDDLILDNVLLNR